MHPHTEELLRHLDATRVALRAAVERIPATLRDTRPAADRWSVAEVLEHLTRVETSITKLLTARLSEARSAGTLPPDTQTSSVLANIDSAGILDRSVRLTAGERSLPRGEMNAAQALDALDKVRATLRELVTAHDGLDLGAITAPHPVLGVINGYEWFAFVANHEARHTLQIRELE